MARIGPLKQKPSIEDAVSIEEAYFFLRTATWDQEDFKQYVGLFEAKGYQAGYDDGYEYHKETQSSEIEFERGYERGFKDGENEGWQQGYDQGYGEANRDEEYRR